MIKFCIILAIGTLCDVFIGFLIGVNAVSKRASDGICIRADDGEAYLRISEEGQRKIMDPSTKILYVRVIDMPSRNNHPL